MVVGPRYIPGVPTGKQGGGWSPDTTSVPDASRITPPVAPPPVRAGHDISIQVKLDAGVPIGEMRSSSHEVSIERQTVSQATVSLNQKTTIPNKDFLLKYEVADARIQDAVLTYRKDTDGFFALILQPPDRVTVEDTTPKELIFVLDTSGSMSGFPIEKAKETMTLALNGLYSRDTFNLITFSGDTAILFPQPVPATSENLAQAKAFLAGRHGAGGTEMMKAVRAALEPSGQPGRVRVVCFMTDGYVGNDMEIVAEVQKHPDSRVFAFGIGSAVNHFLLDNMAREGRGEVEYVGLNDDGSAAARRFHERVRNPLLTNISVDFGKLAVSDVYPRRIPDLFSAKPVVVFGRYSAPQNGVMHIRGTLSGRPYMRDVAVNLPAAETHHDVLATLWARGVVDHWMAFDWAGTQTGEPRADVKAAVTDLGLRYRLMTQFTSFVAVEEKVITEGGLPKRVDVPVEIPEGVNYDTVFGGEQISAAQPMPMMMATPAAMRTGVLGGVPMTAERSLEPAGPLPVIAAPKSKEAGAQPGRKLHPVLAGIVESLKRGQHLEQGQNALVRNGKVRVEVWLADWSPAALDQLRRLGFEADAPGKVTKIRTGRIAIDKLADLSRLTVVQWVAPHS
jgi:Ca-activated chloride channel family protein